MERCPICGKKMEDSRHVGVECFYDVNEYVMDATKREFFIPVDLHGSYWGVTRTYHNGTVDSFIRIEKDPVTLGGNVIQLAVINRNQIPLEEQT